MKVINKIEHTLFVDTSEDLEKRVVGMMREDELYKLSY